MSLLTAVAILNTVEQMFDTKAVLAGGAVRDMLIGLEPRDYDIYTQLPYDDWVIDLIVPARAAQFGHTFTRMGGANSYADTNYENEYGYGNIMVFDGEMLGKKVQIIDQSLDPGDEVAANFCCSFSDCWMDSVGKIHVSPRFAGTLNSKEILFDDRAKDEYKKKIFRKFLKYGYTFGDY